VDLAQLIDGPDVLGLAELDPGSTAAWSLLPSSPAWTSSHDRRSGSCRLAEPRVARTISTDPNIVPPAVEYSMS
jgi:hypothetical protein